MADYALLAQLLHSFPKSHKEDWMSVASQEVQGKNSVQNFTWKSKDEINFQQYYDLQDNASLDYLKNFQVRPSGEAYKDPRSWTCLPRVSVDIIQNANAVALNHLANGADGILFDCSRSNSVDLDILLSDIDWPSCDVSFLVTSSSKIIQPLIEYVTKRNYDPQLLAGSLFCNSTHDNFPDNLKGLDNFLQFSFIGIYISPSTPLSEISSTLTKVTSAVDALIDAGYKAELIWRNISISLPTGNEFFLDIAKQKALRILLYQISRAYQLDTDKIPKLNLRVGPWVNEKFQPHSNMLSSPIAALSAVAGGCDSLTIEGEDENNGTMTRIARNVSNILREEAHVNKVSDPLAGAFAIDQIVDSLARAAWKDFQHKVTRS